jgi:cytochrome c5
VIRYLVCSALLFAATDFAHAEEGVAAARKRWAESPYGPMLERILPPTFDAAKIPEPRSEGARLVKRYCVQCHNLPNPAMHDARRWPSVVERMVLRMRGKGNLGPLMTEMMVGVEAPNENEHRALLAYLRRHAQKPLDPKKYPAVYAGEGESFRLACNQCHVLPDPRRHTAADWPRVVARMQENMEWMNRVVGTKPVPGEPQLRIEDINAFLAKYARKTGRDAAR